MSSNLWDTELLSPGPIDRLGKHDLKRWSDQVQTAIRRHETLMSESGQLMMEASFAQSLERIRQEQESFRDFVQFKAKPSLARLKKLEAQTLKVIEARSAKPGRADERSTASPPKRVQTILESLGLVGESIDQTMLQSVVAKFGSIEAFAETL